MFIGLSLYYEKPMVIDSLNLKLRQIARFSSNVILDEMSSAKCHLLFGLFFFDCSTRRKTTLPYTYGNLSLHLYVAFRILLDVQLSLHKCYFRNSEVIEILMQPLIISSMASRRFCSETFMFYSHFS